MKFKISGLLGSAAMCFGLMGPGAALAQGTWDFGGATCNVSGSPTIAANCAVGSVTASMSAWGYTTGGTGFVQGNLGEFDPNGFGAYTGKYESAAPNHAFDNVTSGCGTTTLAGNSGLSAGNSGCGGNVEGMLVNFGSAKVNLTQIKIGYFSGDADLSVYRWDGASTGPTMGTTVATLGTGALSGWTLVSSNDSDLVNPFNTGSTKYSSYFLITTYFGAAATNLDSGNDAFKILNITANICAGTLTGGNGTPNGNGSTCGTTQNNAPEPGSFALMGIALVGAAAARRRKRA
jgi:PEP-CTERM motif